MSPLVVLGDTLLDRDVHGSAERLSPDAPVPVLAEAGSSSRPGGAGLAAALAATHAHDVTLVTALGGDGAAEELRAGLERGGVEVVDLGLHGPTPEKVRFLAGGRSLLRLDRGADPAAIGPASAAARAAVGWADAVLVSDYGRGIAAEPGLREAVAEVAGRVPVVWDPHPRGATPIGGAAAVTPNAAEAGGFAPGSGDATAQAEALRERWRARAVCVTRGQGGALLVSEDAAPLVVPTVPARGGDPCGAGDRFASRLAVALADGWTLADAAVTAVNSASAFVAAGGARAALAGPEGGDDAGALGVAEHVRGAGGTVVATGGCFDLLHAGHIRMLEAARRLGDCLIVLLNSDASVRSLKGPGRPLVPERDRAAVLGALGCVDAVMIFEEATPELALRGLRPHVWAKGGDYRPGTLPEEAALAQWGARAVFLPYMDGHSTTGLIERAAAHA
ncbi:MAG TPA: PfkB family carbohydrate kinase [Solirubrobacteraceae bacterium]|nr:PfkB family carbohydrate kinase [Solirubrobacteraceae bacterium]